MNDAHDPRARPEGLGAVDLNLAVAFDAMAREGSVTAAARSAGVTQSAMSHSLRRLRELLDDPVFVRVGNAMALTPRGEALVVPVRGALSTLARALFTPARFDPATARRSFTLATPDLFDVLTMPPLLAHVGAHAPGVDLTVLPLSKRLVTQLATGEVDLAVVPRFERAASAPPDPDADGLVRRALFRDRFVCLLRAGHPALRRRAATLPLETWLALPHALVSPRGDPAGPVDEALAMIGRRRRVGLSVPHFTSALAIVAESDLVLTAPSGATLLDVGRRLVALAPPIALPRHTVTMLWHERYTHDPGHRWLRERMLSVAKEVGARIPPIRARAAS